MGAMIGGAVGSVAHTLLPVYTAAPGAYALVGMGAAFAGIVRVPITSVIMVFEMTRDYTIIVPLMISNLIAFLISYQLQSEPIYDALARQEGVYLPTAESRAERSRSRVLQVMEPPGELLPAKLSVLEALRRVEQSKVHGWPVADGNGLCGVISTLELENAMEQGFGNLRVEEVLKHRFPKSASDSSEPAYVHTDHNLAVALERMGACGYDLLTVVSRNNLRGLLGTEGPSNAYSLPTA